MRQRAYPNRSRAIEEAVKEKLERLDRRRLARECEKLDVNFEEKMAEEGLSGRSSSERQLTNPTAPCPLLPTPRSRLTNVTWSTITYHLAHALLITDTEQPPQAEPWHT